MELVILYKLIECKYDIVSVIIIKCFSFVYFVEYYFFSFVIVLVGVESLFVVFWRKVSVNFIMI